MDPAHCFDLIHQTVVPGGIMTAFFCEFRMDKETEDIETVGHGDQDAREGVG